MYFFCTDKSYGFRYYYTKVPLKITEGFSVPYETLKDQIVIIDQTTTPQNIP